MKIGSNAAQEQQENTLQPTEARHLPKDGFAPNTTRPDSKERRTPMLLQSAEKHCQNRIQIAIQKL